MIFLMMSLQDLGNEVFDLSFPSTFQKKKIKKEREKCNKNYTLDVYLCFFFFFFPLCVFVYVC